MQNNDVYGLLINPAQSSLRVFCSTTRIGQTYLEDYGNPLIYADDYTVRDMHDLHVNLKIPPRSQMVVMSNSLYLREIATVETMNSLIEDMEVVEGYLKGRELPEWFIQEAYEQTKQWVGRHIDT